MRALYTAVYFLAVAYLLYNNAPHRFMVISIFLYLAGYLVICFLEDFLIEFRKELEDRKNNE